MMEPGFFEPPRPVTVAEIARLTEAKLAGGDPERRIAGIAPLDSAQPMHLSFFESKRFADALATTRAGACFCVEAHVGLVPPGTAALVTPSPHKAFAVAASRLYPAATRPQALMGGEGISPAASVHATARVEAGATVEAGAVVGPAAEIGRGTLVAAGAVIGEGVRIGRDAAIGPNATVIHALVGNRLTLHPGVRVGQDGFGYVPGPAGHLKVPQIGRVIIQDDVEIGAGTAIDRGAIRDTVIGEGTKIDNLVQVGHNVSIGRHCILVAQTGIAGSSTLEDYVVLGARVGINTSVTIGEGAQIAGTSIVHGDVPPGARWGGTPAKPVKLWFREMKLLEQMARRKSGSGAAADE